MKSILFFFLLFISRLVVAADSGLSPEYLKLKVYKFAVSKSEYCTDPIVVFETEEADATFEDFLTNPVLGSGTLDNGTYPCVMFEFSDVITYAADQNSDTGNCAAGEEISDEICTADWADLIKLIDGTPSSCVNGEQRVAIYLSTASTNPSDGGGSSFIPPTADNANLGIPLSGGLTVAEGVIAKFVVDAAGLIQDDGGSCWMSRPNFGFSQE